MEKIKCQILNAVFYQQIYVWCTFMYYVRINYLYWVAYTDYIDGISIWKIIVYDFYI